MHTLIKKLFPGYTLGGDTGESIDWVLFLATLPILGAGLVTMNSFTGDSHFFIRQSIWIIVSVVVFFGLSTIDFRFLRTTWASIGMFIASCGLLLVLFVIGHTVKGAQSWFNLGFFSFEPAEPIKLVVIFILAKYFSRRHIEIANIRHIVVSGIYAFIIFILVVLQPDFGSAVIIFLIWFGMVLVSGISKKHIMAVACIGLVAFGGLWMFGFKEYQKNRIKTFVNPLSDIHGTGYNVNQSIIAVGSGQVWGKGVGYGTQSRLRFLPEFQTDFIFAAFAEEWGFVGVVLVSLLFGVVIWRIISISLRGATNFETLFGVGLAIFFVAHIVINAGMNIGVMPVTGITLPFMSYGGTHILTEFIGLGILMGMRRYNRAAHRDTMKQEYIGQ